jgi:hypothetical protein
MATRTKPAALSIEQRRARLRELFDGLSPHDVDTLIGHALTDIKAEANGSG